MTLRKAEMNLSGGFIQNGESGACTRCGGAYSVSLYIKKALAGLGKSFKLNMKISVQFISRKNVSNKECAKLAVACADFVKAHFVNKFFELKHII